MELYLSEFLKSNKNILESILKYNCFFSKIFLDHTVSEITIPLQSNRFVTIEECKHVTLEIRSNLSSGFTAVDLLNLPECFKQDF